MSTLKATRAGGVELTASGERLESLDNGGGLTREGFLRRSAAAGVALGVAGQATSLARAASSKPKRGGTFRVAVSGGSAKDFIDGQSAVTRPDQARLLTGWETLVVFDSEFKLRFDGLAEEIVPNRAGDVWTIRVRDGVEFHNGKTLSAADVRYSLRRLVDPRLAGLNVFSGPVWGSIDPARIDVVDPRTVRLNLKRRDATLLEGLAQYLAGIVPVGYGTTAIGRAKPNVGTGSYTLKSFTPGQRSVHTRNLNYWRTDQPYFDEVVVIDIFDDTERVNALVSGQVDAITDLPPSQVTIVNRRSTNVLESPSGHWTPLCMRVDAPPFDDVRVRQAFRLIPDRQQMVRQALAGHGSIGNDVYAPFDEDAARFPERRQDLDRARFLLRAAGQSGLEVDLYTTDSVRGMNEGAEVFARHARNAGVSVNVRELRQFGPNGLYGPKYLKWIFSTDYWALRNYLNMVTVGCLPSSVFNETHWGNPTFVSLYKQARETVDRPKRRELIRRMMKMEYDSGGYLISGFSTRLDGYSTKVRGLKNDDKGALPLNTFGHGYRTIWFG